MIFYGDGIYNIALITATIYLNSNCKLDKTRKFGLFL